MGLPAGLGADVEKPRRMTILHPKTNRPLMIKTVVEAPSVDGGEPRKVEEPAWIDVYSSDSEVARKHSREQINARLSSKRRRNTLMSAEEIDANGNELLAVLTADWKLGTLDGEPITNFPCNRESAFELYSAPEMAWLKAQVDEFASEIGNFVTDSSKS